MATGPSLTSLMAMWHLKAILAKGMGRKDCALRRKRHSWRPKLPWLLRKETSGASKTSYLVDGMRKPARRKNGAPP